MGASGHRPPARSPEPAHEAPAAAVDPVGTIAWPPRLDLARQPTPLQRLTRYGARVGAEIWVKRDDLTGFLCSGNKIRKLEFVLARALAEGAQAVATCGGVNSNHCRATAVLAARLGLRADLFLRTPDGCPPATWQANNLLAALAGARCHWISPLQYAERDALLADHVQRCASEGVAVSAIPEGASSGLGALGYVRAIQELHGQLHSAGLEIDVLVHAMGSGGTSAGLDAGRLHWHCAWQLRGYPVCDDAAHFQARVLGLRRELQAYGLPAPDPHPEAQGFVIRDGAQGRGYGLTTPAELRFLAELCAEEGILLDPCYTGKAFRAMHQELRQGIIPPHSRVLFLHTGGTFGIHAYADEWQTVLGSPAGSS